MILQQYYRDIMLLALIPLLKLIIRTFNCLMDDHAGVWSWCSLTSWNLACSLPFPLFCMADEPLQDIYPIKYSFTHGEQEPAHRDAGCQCITGRSTLLMDIIVPRATHWRAPCGPSCFALKRRCHHPGTCGDSVFDRAWAQLSWPFFCRNSNWVKLNPQSTYACTRGCKLSTSWPWQNWERWKFSY